MSQFSSSLLLALYFNVYLTSQVSVFSWKAQIRTEMDKRVELIFNESGTILP